MPTDKEKVRNIVIDRITGNWYRQYIIELNSGNKTPVGIIHIHDYVEERKSYEIGWCVLPEHRRQGYGFEAANIILKIAFEDFGAHKVVAMCNSYNEASYRIMEHLGMKREAIFRQELPWNGKWVDQYFYAMIDSEYKNSVKY